MGILKAYNRQVGRSSQIGAVASSGAGSGAMALGGAMTEIAMAHLSKLEADTTQAEVAKGRADAKLAWNAAQIEMKGLSEPDDISDFYNKWENKQKSALAGMKLTDRSRGILNADAEGHFAEKRIMSLGLGGFKDNAQIKKNDNVDVIGMKNAIDAEDYDQYMIHTANRGRRGTMTAKEVDSANKRFANEVDKKHLSAGTYSNPSSAIEAIDAQLSGKETTWKHLSDSDLKSARAYAKKLQTEVTTEAADFLYDKGSQYQKMTPIEKQGHIDALRDKGAISAKTWSIENDLIREPKFIDATPDHMKIFLDHQRQMTKVGDNPEKLADIFNSLADEALPQKMKTDLLEFAKEIQDPMSSLNRKAITYGFDQVDESFYREDIVPQPTGWFKIGDRTPKDYDDYRFAIQTKAVYEVKQAYLKWIRTDGAGSSPPQINEWIANETIAAKERYKIPTLPSHIEELQGTAQVTAEPEDTNKEDIDFEDMTDEELEAYINE